MNRIKKLSIVFFFTTLSCFAEERLIINFIPHNGFNADLSFINDKGYRNYPDFIKYLREGKKVWFESFIPKEGILEGEYQLYIYDDDDCIEKFSIVNQDYVYNSTKKVFQKNTHILDKVRSILFIEYLRYQSTMILDNS